MLRQRPSARSLLNHPFIQSAGSKSVLVPLIERFTRYKAGKSKSSPPRPIPTISDAGDTIVREGWEYETIMAGPSQADSLISNGRYSATSRGVGDGYREDDLEDERERFRTVQVREVEGNEVGARILPHPTAADTRTTATPRPHALVPKRLKRRPTASPYARAVADGFRIRRIERRVGHHPTCCSAAAARATGRERGGGCVQSRQSTKSGCKGDDDHRRDRCTCANCREFGVLSSS